MATTPGSAPSKAMSSRLLTMKFMQRAANTSPSINTSSSPDRPSLKRRRTDPDASLSQRNVDSLADRAAVQAALAREEAKRQAALDKQAADAGDTRWVLNFGDHKHSASPALSLRIVQTGFANLDSSPSKMRIEEDDPEDKPAMVGRRSFGRFNKTLEKQQDPSYQDTDESSSDSEEDNKDDPDDESDDDDPMNQLIRLGRQDAADRARAERKAKKRAANEDLEQMAKKRRKQDINLNTEVNLQELTSLSGRQEINTASTVECFRCGGPHRKKDCPKEANITSTVKCFRCGGPHHKKDCPEEDNLAPSVKCYTCGGPHLKRDCHETKRSYQGGDDGLRRKLRKSS